jgi:hypothetical protein
MACAIRVAAEHARFGQPEVKLGVIPGFGGTQRMPRLVGRGAALRLILSGEPIDAQEAYRIGLVDEVVPAAELIARAEAILERITANAPLAIRFAIEAVNKGLEGSQQEGLASRLRCSPLCAATHDKAGRDVGLPREARAEVRRTMRRRMATTDERRRVLRLKVVDLASFIAGPSAAVILSDFVPMSSRWSRLRATCGTRARDRAAASREGGVSWHLANRNKRGMALDLKSPVLGRSSRARPVGGRLIVNTPIPRARGSGSNTTTSCSGTHG